MKNRIIVYYVSLAPTCTASIATDRAIGRHFCAHTRMCTGLKLVVLYVHVLKCVIHVVLHKLHACFTSLALLSKVKELWLHVLCIIIYIPSCTQASWHCNCACRTDLCAMVSYTGCMQICIHIHLASSCTEQ